MLKKQFKFTFTSLLLLCLGLSQATAVPIQLGQAAFNSAVSGLSPITEDFEGVPDTFSGTTLDFANGSFSSQSGDVRVFASSTFCGSSTDKCLFTASISGERSIFDLLPLGATYWGADIFQLNSLDNMQVTVTGGSGTQIFSSTGLGFWGFHDALGISSVTFENLGTGSGFSNYSFDDITTAGSAMVPEPLTLILMFMGLVGLGAQRRRLG